MLKISFLSFCLLNAWFAYNLYNPNFKSKRLMIPSFAAGWLVGELAFFVIGFQVLMTIIFVQLGAASGFLGNLGLLLNLASWFMYANFYLSAADTPNVFEDALRTSLGNEYSSVIDDAVLSSIPEKVEIERLLKPFSLDLPGVERIKNIEYDQQSGMHLKLDIYRSRDDKNDDKSKKPVLFQIHGGGWTHRFGSKNEQARPLMNHMASQGWISVSVDYRLSPQATFPEHIIDCKKALVWVKDNIAEYGGDPDFIVATGGSAGGHLSSLLALSANDPDFQPGFEEANTEVQACVPFYGVYDFANSNDLQANSGLASFVGKTVMKLRLKGNEEAYRKASPINRIHKDAPPFLIIQGDSDTLVSAPEAAYFASELDAISEQHVCYVELEGAQHAFDIFISSRSEHCKHGVNKYLSYVHAQYLAQEGRVEKVENSLSEAV